VSPLQEFRVWARRAPASERAGAAVAAAVVVAVLGWLLVPAGDTSSTNLAAAQAGSPGSSAIPSTAGGPATGGATSTTSGSLPAIGSSGGAAPTAGSGSASGAVTTVGGSDTSAPTFGPPGCVSPPGSAPGVTAGQIKIAVTLTNILGPATNSLFGIAPPSQQRAWYDAVIADINAAGGVACRKLVAQYYMANPADQSDLQQKCLDIVQAGMFAEIDNGSYAVYPQKECFAQHRIPYFGAYFLSKSNIDAFYPYLFNLVQFDALERNTILGLKQRGFFDPANGFKKLGFIYQDCDAGLVNSATTAIQQAGVPSSQVVGFDVGCPATFSSPGTLLQVILKFRQSGVTHVTFTHFVGDFANFTNLADQQGFRPKYGLPDEDLIDISYGSMRPKASNIVGAVVITSGRSGEERTPGSTPSAATARCDAAYHAHGLPPTYQQPAGAGYTCDQLWMFKAAVENAPALQTSQLAAGLQKAKSVDFSYPAGPNDFSGAHTTTGGQFWRAAQFMPGCNCWQIVDPTFHPSL
jgi:hypothetical protein